MAIPTKIATCCYCGTRAVLVLDRVRHELSCSSCGAPLHNLKKLPQTARQPEWAPGFRASAPQARNEKRNTPRKVCEARKRSKHKKRRGLMRHLFEEAFDALEDIFD